MQEMKAINALRQEPAPDRPNPHHICASQSKTTRWSRPIHPAPTATGLSHRTGTVPSRQRKFALALKTILKENEMGTIFGRRLLLGAVIASSVGIGYAIGAQPHMEATIGILQSARAELVKATPNKGGHRERALGLIDQAIGEVRAGMAFAAGG